VNLKDSTVESRQMWDADGYRRAYAVLVGIDRYEDSRMALRHAGADAKGVRDVLLDPNVGRFRPDRVRVLVDEDASRTAVTSAIGEWLSRAAEEDSLVCVYYAGHGVPEIDPSGGPTKKYLLPYDGDVDRPFSTCIAMDDVQKWFRRIRAREILCFLDTCHSGAADPGMFSNPAFHARSAMELPDLAEDLAGEGRVVIASCSPTELSLESDEHGHGLFTYHLIEGLRGAADANGDGVVTESELFDYVSSAVRRDAQIRGGRMTPLRAGTSQGSMALAVGVAAGTPPPRSPSSGSAVPTPRTPPVTPKRRLTATHVGIGVAAVAVPLALWAALGTDGPTGPTSTAATLSIEPPGDVTVLVNGERQLSAALTSGADSAALSPVTWSSADPSVAVVSLSGMVTGVAAGSTVVVASGWARRTDLPDSVHVGDTVQVSVALDEVVQILPSPGTVAGRVLVDGRPLSGVMLTISEGRFARTRSDGTYSFGSLEPGPYTVRLSVGEAADTISFDRLSAEVSLADGGSRSADFSGTLRSSILQGRVTRGTDGLSGVTVSLDGERASVEAVTGADGAYVFDELRPGSYEMSLRGLPSDVIMATLSRRIELGAARAETENWDGLDDREDDSGTDIARDIPDQLRRAIPVPSDTEVGDLFDSLGEALAVDAAAVEALFPTYRSGGFDAPLPVGADYSFSPGEIEPGPNGAFDVPVLETTSFGGQQISETVNYQIERSSSGGWQIRSRQAS